MILSALVACVAACSTSKNHTVDETQTLSPRVIRVGDPVPKGGGVYKLGEPYLAGGKWYTPVADASYDKVGMASWYGDFFHGRKTANGEIYDMNALSAAHQTFPMPSYAKVTNLSNSRSIIVRVNDRGPYASDRIIDLSHQAALILGFHTRGTTQVRVQYWGPAPLNGDDSYERRMLAKQSWSTHVENVPPPSSSSSTMLASAITVTPQPTVQTSVTEVAKTSNVRTTFSLPTPTWGSATPSLGFETRVSFSGN